MQGRGIRGAITIEQDKPEEIISATCELLQAILDANPTLRAENIGSVIFTVTPDIVSEFPAKAARVLGWKSVPLMCMQEIPVPGSLSKCIRVLVSWNTKLKQKDVNHIYLKDAVSLRPDLMEGVS
ncbi:MAG TPA: chorismate mutase [candidate division Zixibacteria bacterium]|nr:chorismate mutase [candidate division Zixibacteria bacterium]